MSYKTTNYNNTNNMYDDNLDDIRKKVFTGYPFALSNERVMTLSFRVYVSQTGTDLTDAEFFGGIRAIIKDINKLKTA